MCAKVEPWSQKGSGSQDCPDMGTASSWSGRAHQVNISTFRRPLLCPLPSTLQVNMYQGGGRPAAASYKAYLSSDAAPGRPDGYGLREWKHDPSGALWNVSATAAAATCLLPAVVGRLRCLITLPTTATSSLCQCYVFASTECQNVSRLPPAFTCPPDHVRD